MAQRTRSANRGAGRSLGIAVAAFGTFSSAAQLWAMGPTWTIVTLTATAACVATGVVITVRSYRSPDQAIQLLRKLLRPTQGTQFSTRRVSTEAELHQVTLIDDQHYGEENIPSATLLAWWRAYPRGVWILWNHGKCVGVIGFWPLRKQPFSELLRGERAEHQIHGNSIDRSPQRSRWYIGGIIVAKEVCGPKALQELIRTAVTEWITSGDLAPKIDIAAIAYTVAGERMLNHLDFMIATRKEASTHSHAVYSRHGLEIAQIQSQIEPLIK